MNILLRHTLNSVARNPVQSLIVVISTAMITACVLLCLTISVLFELTAMLWANSNYAGADIIVFSSTTETTATVDGWLAENADAVKDSIVTLEGSFSILSETETLESEAIGVGMGLLDKFDSLTKAEVLSRCENDTSLPSAHVSLSFAKKLGVGAGDTFTVKNGTSFFIETVCNNTARYYANPRIVFVYETPDVGKGYGLKYFLWLNDPYAVTADGRHLKDACASEIGAAIGNPSAAQSTLDASIRDSMQSVKGSKQLLNVAAAIIIVVMACLLYSSFSVIVRGRVNELVKFKAAGATPLQATLILLSEAVLYAVAGGLIGLGVGEGLIGFLNGMLAENVANAGISAGVGQYIAALVIGAACGVAACSLPAASMSLTPIHALIGGTERFVKKLPAPAAVLLTAAALALSTACFFVPTSALTAVGICAVATLFIWVVTVMPHVLGLVCAAARRLTPPGAGYVAECAAPKSAAVSASHTMLVALIAFIWLGSCLIDTVNLTGIPSHGRFDVDFVLTSSINDPEVYQTELERALALDGIEQGAMITRTYGTTVCLPDGTPVNKDFADDPLDLHIVAKGEDINFCTSVPLDEEAVHRFDALAEKGGDPIVVTRYYADKYGIAVGDELRLMKKTGDETVATKELFTVVGIDDTITSWDHIAFICAGSTLDETLFTGFDYVVYLRGDQSRFTELRAALDTDTTTLFKRSGYFNNESADNLDTERILDMFSIMIYAIAALGLVNLVLITANERRKEFDVLRLAGMTPSDAAGYILTETAILSFCGFAFGLLSAFFANAASRGIAQLVDKYAPLDVFPSDMAVIAVAAAGVFALVWAVSHCVAFAQVSSSRYAKRDDRMLRHE